MASTPNDMSGILGKNNYKNESKHPDYTGTVNVRGEVLRIAAWKKTSSHSGDSFLSLKFSEVQEKAKTTTSKASVTKAESSAEMDEEDGFPF